MKKILSFLMLLMIPLLAACQASDGGAEESANASDEEPLQIVSTTTMLTDLVNVIGGEHVEVEGLMGPGVDPHGYQASASDVTTLMKADAVAYNGLHLEAQLGEIFSELDKQGKEVFVLEEAIPGENRLSSEEADMAYDPHIWFSVENWKLAANYIAEQLSAFDPGNEADYTENNQQYQQELDELSQYISSRIEEVPEESRVLVTAHDAFAYFGEAFDFEVIGLQGLNSQTEAGTRDVSELADFVADRQIKAIFVESSVPIRTIQSLQEAVLQRGWEVTIGGELFSDALGDETQDAETYLKMYRHNIDTIVDALK